jgi:signal transduction histidine kinase
VFAERRQTVDSSIAYLETLATSYQRLSRPPDRRDCDLNALVTDVVARHAGPRARRVRDSVAANLPRVVGDPIAFRRILENVMSNAVDSLESKPGRVTVSTEVSSPSPAPGDPCRRR